MAGETSINRMYTGAAIKVSLQTFEKKRIEKQFSICCNDFQSIKRQPGSTHVWLKAAPDVFASR